MSANVQTWEVSAGRAECRACGWKGPLRETRLDARPDAEGHECPKLCDSNCGPVGHVTGCAAAAGRGRR